MLEKVIMPTLGLGMEEAVILQWLKRAGDSVVKDEPLLTVETDKATTEINAPASGVLHQIRYEDGTTVPVTQIIAYIETDATGAESEASEAPEQPGSATVDQKTVASPRVAEVGATPAERAPQSREPDGTRASPAARRLARDLGIDLSTITGTGPRGRIQGEDVRRAADARGGVTQVPSGVPGTPPSVLGGLPGRLVPLGRKRRVTAERMSASARSVPRVTLNAEVDAGELIALRSRLKPAYEAAGVRLAYDAILAKVVAEALVGHPEMNARWAEDGIFLVEPINVGVAIAVEEGLLVPVIRDANRKRLEEVAKEFDGLVEKGKADRLTADDMSGGTFTITNLGSFGVDFFSPLVNPPECAILGVGRIAERPVGRNGQLVLRPTMMLSLTFDHRVVDGAPAGRFLQRIQQLIEETYLLI